MKKKIIYIFLALGVCFAYAAGSQEGTTKKEKFFKPGKYIAKAVGYAGGLKVEVTVNEKKILKIKIISHNETIRYLEECEKPVIDRILKEQKTDVDIVAGATMSSKGIMKAVEKALKQALIQ